MQKDISMICSRSEIVLCDLDEGFGEQTGGHERRGSWPSPSWRILVGRILVEGVCPGAEAAAKHLMTHHHILRPT